MALRIENTYSQPWQPAGAFSFLHTAGLAECQQGEDMKMPDKNPDVWGPLLAWLAAHKEGGGYAATAALMALLRSAYVGRDGWPRRLIDAAMCALAAYFIKDCLDAVGWDVKYATLGSIFIGSAGVDYFGSLLRRFVGARTGTSSRE